MRVSGKHYRTVWQSPEDAAGLWIIDQRLLPFAFATCRLDSVAGVADAISTMAVRGAGCIGATAGWGMWLAARECGEDKDALLALAQQIKATRPTAVNLAWAVDRQLASLLAAPSGEWVALAHANATEIANEDAAACESIGQHGLGLLQQLYAEKGRPLNVLTHCNAGWLAFVDHGSATAPIYAAHDAGIPVHVWVDETRPRNQGARLTAWELAQHGVPHTLIVDNAGGHLMQRGQVDCVIVGADRVTRRGDVANKIGTYLKALAANDVGIPFYVALPSSTIDWASLDGLAEIPIEERSAAEVLVMSGIAATSSRMETHVSIAPQGTVAANPAFDVTPNRLVTALITEAGVCAASEQALRALFPDR